MGINQEHRQEHRDSAQREASGEARGEARSEGPRAERGNYPAGIHPGLLQRKTARRLQRRTDAAKPPQGAVGDEELGPARTIQVSGGQRITVYGTFASNVEAALADGWLSTIDMEALWRTGTHADGSDDAGHTVFQMLTQRPCHDGKVGRNEGYTRSEIATWEGPSAQGGVNRMGDLSHEGGSGPKATRFQFYLDRMLDFGGGVINVDSYIDRICGEATLAPDDQGRLVRLYSLQYLANFPSQNFRPASSRLAGWSISDADKRNYKAMLNGRKTNWADVDKLAIGLGLPPPATK